MYLSALNLFGFNSSVLLRIPWVPQWLTCLIVIYAPVESVFSFLHDSSDFPFALKILCRISSKQSPWRVWLGMFSSLDVFHWQWVFKVPASKVLFLLFRWKEIKYLLQNSAFLPNLPRILRALLSCRIALLKGFLLSSQSLQLILQLWHGSSLETSYYFTFSCVTGWDHPTFTLNMLECSHKAVLERWLSFYLV